MTGRPSKPDLRIDPQLDRIEKALIGNGQRGLLDRVARNEENISEIKQDVGGVKTDALQEKLRSDSAIAKLADSVNLLTINIDRLGTTVTSHLGTDHLSVLMKKKSFWVLIAVGMIALHMIATYVPNVWDGAMLLLGLPKLQLPPPAG
jgi:hypothetical protein